MNASAIIMMIVTLVIVWGGLAASLFHLFTHPDEGE
ncbi:methionine/alanine import family NSS transporter small subunit [Hoyosella altamirensis]|uniref:Flagellar basal body-associated protein FliL n=1 Tax=Hoyosella altamirensis TaxID=616997 RepID=A0A839RIV8_9ACTN|nr:methionine/alanine import family NSS transporter small subunit [Hoyosella altamirensis]MBB3036066.1 flagellar basal body-associated protein FliL [Hoyosella altamirensis]